MMEHSLEWELERIVEEMRPNEFSFLELLDDSVLLEAIPQPQQGQSGAHGGSDRPTTVESILERLLEDLDDGDIFSSFADSPPPTPTPAPELGLGGDVCFLLQEAAPALTAAPPAYTVIAQGPDPMYSQAAAQNQLQYLPYQRPVGAVSHPAAPPHKYFDPAPMILPGAISERPPCAGRLKRNNRRQLEESRPYVKRPPNAFMLFIKEQRPNVGPEVKSRGSAAVNVFLGQIWSSLTKEQQARYYQQAEGQRLLHKQQHPGWSVSDNYGKKRKRGRRRTPSSVEAATPEDTLQAKRWCVTPPPAALQEFNPASGLTAFPVLLCCP